MKKKKQKLVTFSASVDPTRQIESKSGRYRLRRVPIAFRAGSYPDKKFSMTTEELRAAVRNFSQPLDMDSEHKASVFDGSLGKLVGVEMNGKNAMSAFVAVPAWLEEVVPPEKQAISLSFHPKKKNIVGTAWTHNPRITEAKMAASFSADVEENGDLDTIDDIEDEFDIDETPPPPKAKKAKKAKAKVEIDEIDEDDGEGTDGEDDDDESVDDEDEDEDADEDDELEEDDEEDSDFSNDDEDDDDAPHVDFGLDDSEDEDEEEATGKDLLDGIFKQASKALDEFDPNVNSEQYGKRLKKIAELSRLDDDPESDDSEEDEILDDGETPEDGKKKKSAKKKKVKVAFSADPKDPRTKALLKDRRARMASEAASFADDLIRKHKVLPRKKAGIIQGYISASEEDLVNFSGVGGEGVNLQQFKQKLYAKKPLPYFTESLSESEVALMAQDQFRESADFSVGDEVQPSNQKLSEDRRREMLSFTSVGRAVLADSQKKN